ncbi:MAG: DNA polymerase III subunit delta [Limnochordia bacterium]|jgi:DNA polymerase-3 subunit delta
MIHAIFDDWQRGEFPQISLLYGPEDFLKNQAWRDLVGKILRPEEYQWALTRLEGGRTTAREILSHLLTVPFGASTGVVVLTGADELELEQQNELAEGLDGLPGDCYLLLVARDLDKTRKLYKRIVKHGKAYQFPRLQGAGLTRWIATRAEQLNLSLPPGYAQEMVTLLGDDLGLINHELEKLALYADGKPLSKKEAQDLLFPGDPQDDRLIFSLADGVAAGDVQGALEHLNRLLAWGVEPLHILAMLARQFRLISQALTVGRRPEVMQKTYGVHSFVAKKACQQAGNYTEKELPPIWSALVEGDAQLKGSLPAKLVLEMLIVALAEKKTPW